MNYHFVIFLFIALLLFIAVEDFRFRAISWWAFPLLSVMSFAVSAMEIQLNFILINLGFILVQLLCLTIYFSVKNKKIINITQDYLGWGDVLFWIAVSFLFSPLNFFGFYFISMFLSFIVAIVMRIINKDNSFIPLAGIQASILVLATLANLAFHFTEFQNDRLIENMIAG